MTLNQILRLLPFDGYKSKIGTVGASLSALAKLLLFVATFLAGDMPIPTFLMQLQDYLVPLTVGFGVFGLAGLYHKIQKLADKLKGLLPASEPQPEDHEG